MKKGPVFLLTVYIIVSDSYRYLTLALGQGSHSPGKSGRVRELIWSGKVREFCWWSGNFGSLRMKTTIFIYVSRQSSYSLM